MDRESTNIITTRPALADVALALCLVGLAVFTAIIEGNRDVTGVDSPSAWWDWLLVVGPSLPVAFRRSAPLIATPISIAAQIVVWGSGLATPFFAPLVMIYSVCAEEGKRGRKLGIASGIALCCMTLVGVFAADDVTIDLLVFTALACLVVYLLGTQTAQRRATEIALAEELAVTRAERDMVHERAAGDERQRIARELHDIVGHSLSVIAVRAEAADRVAAKNPDAAVDAVGAIASTARSSLADVRRVLAGLREESAELELAPLPSLDSIPALVSSFNDAGVDVAMMTDPAIADVGAPVGAGAYRIVQEALTNVLKHGGPSATATVQLTTGQGMLVVSIEDTGRGLASDNGTGLGLGLTGMAERAEVLGGTLHSGPRSGGGYAVQAELPLERSATKAHQRSSQDADV